MTNEHITDERAAFEAWYREHHGSRVSFSQYDTGTFKGDYREALVDGAWNVWQASRAALRPAAQPVGEPVYWEWRHLSTHPDTVDFGQWSEWKRVERRSALHTVDDALAEFRAYIEQGYKYELRALYTTPQPSPERVPMTLATHDEIQAARTADTDADEWPEAWSFKRGWQCAEVHHGITTPKADK